MKKLRIDELVVESYVTNPESTGRVGTVHGLQVSRGCTFVCSHVFTCLTTCSRPQTCDESCFGTCFDSCGCSGFETCADYFTCGIDCP